MQMLYDSDTFVVLHMQPDLGQPEKILLSDGKTETPALPRHGFEIVDKRTGKEVYLDGEWAELFQRQIRTTCSGGAQAPLLAATIRRL